MGDKLVVTSAKEWRKLREIGMEVQLPTGRVVKLRPVAMQELLLTGKIPDSLTPLVARIINAGSYNSDNPIEDAKSSIELYKMICTSAMLEPRLSDNPTGAYEISYFDLTESEAAAIVNWAQNPQVALESFRQEQE